jgi:16S rRNA G966 N2-methylase RsmD
MDVAKFLKTSPHAFDLIFADPPDQLPAQDKLVSACQTNGWLKKVAGSF